AWSTCRPPRHHTCSAHPGPRRPPPATGAHPSPERNPPEHRSPDDQRGSGTVDPLLGAVVEDLPLPDRQPPLDLVDEFAASAEGLLPVVGGNRAHPGGVRSAERTSELQSRENLGCRLLRE